MATAAMSHGSTLPAPVDRLDTLAPWPWDILDPEAPPTLGWHAIAWAEGWSGFPGLNGFRGLTQPNGPRAGKPFKFTPRQRQFLLWYYSLDEYGQWIFMAAVRRLAKGSGKSPFAAVLCLIELLAPVRFNGFRSAKEFTPGGVLARTVDLPLVQIAATAESQTANTMRMVRAFASKESHVVDFYNLDPGKTQYYTLDDGKLEVITASVTASEGAESSFICKDETEHWIPSNSGPELSSTLDDNLAKSGARSLATCNAHVPGADSVAESDFDSWVAQEEGRLRDETGVLYDAVIAPDATDINEPESLRAALQVVYADCVWKMPHEPDPDNPGDLRPIPGSAPDVEPLMRRIWSTRSKVDDARRKYLNRPTVADDAWTTPEEWALLADLERVVEPGEHAVMFFDGSLSDDATALIGCTVDDGHIFTIGIWEVTDERPRIPVTEVDEIVAASFARWNIRGFFGDVREWESFVKVTWPRDYADGLGVMAVPGGRAPEPIAWDMRSRTNEFTLECELVLTEIEGGQFTHDGNPILARHVANMRRRPNRYGVSVGKESAKSSKKIDGGVSMVGARHVRRRLLSAPQKKKKQPGRGAGLRG